MTTGPCNNEKEPELAASPNDPGLIVNKACYFEIFPTFLLRIIHRLPLTVGKKAMPSFHQQTLRTLGQCARQG